MKASTTHSIAFAAALLTSTIFIAGCQATATEPVNRPLSVQSDESSITIFRQHDEERATYVVNGKRFSWIDLSPEQQQRLNQIEAKLKTAEAKLNINEKQMNEIASQMESKAQVIEAEARKLQQATITLEKREISFADLSEISRQLEEKAQVNEVLMREKEAELHELEKQMPVIDEAALREIEAQAKVMETVLVEIAAELP